MAERTLTLEDQVHSVLFGGDRSVNTLMLDFPGHSESSIRAALYRLYGKNRVGRYGYQPILWFAKLEQNNG